MTEVTLDERDETFLVLRVAAADDPGAPVEMRWSAHVCDPASPLAGLYAFGSSVREVREAVAGLAWQAVVDGELVPFGYPANNLAGIHVVVSCTTAYDAAWLTAAVGNRVA